MDLGLKDQLAIIVGGARGIGLATAELLLAEGCSCRIVGLCRSGAQQRC